jgi:hypothetical protein
MTVWITKKSPTEEQKRGSTEDHKRKTGELNNTAKQKGN